MLSTEEAKRLFGDKTIMVTGGLGSIGSEIVRQLLRYDPKTVRILDNRETELFYAGNRYRTTPNVELVLADVRDRDRLQKAAEGVDLVFHAAALKHVLVCEHDPFEAVKTNVIGTQNIIECALDQGAERVILISTDKVVNPTNVMGATKLLAERLVGAACNGEGHNATKFGIVRFGNVLASRGSVLEIWDRQLQEGKKITITDPEMTRFLMSIPQSVSLVFAATYYADDGETFILRMPSIRIGDLAEAYLKLRGFPTRHSEIVGIRAGEKMHERLLFDEEMGMLLSNDEMFVRMPLRINPIKGVGRLEAVGFRRCSETVCSSKDQQNLMNAAAIEEVLSSAANL